jgi:hypothetical protein
MSGPGASSQGVPVTRERIEGCLRSAVFWVNELPRYADQQQRLADAWAILAGVLAALTSLSIFPVLGEGATDLQRGVVSAAALLAAICALVPRVKNYAELAGQARELSSRYGGVTGDLLDLAKAEVIDQEAARALVMEFGSIKEKKDALRGLPDREKVEIRRADMARRASEARMRAAQAARAEAESKAAMPAGPQGSAGAGGGQGRD